MGRECCISGHEEKQNKVQNYYKTLEQVRTTWGPGWRHNIEMQSEVIKNPDCYNSNKISSGGTLGTFNLAHQ